MKRIALALAALAALAAPAAAKDLAGMTGVGFTKAFTLDQAGASNLVVRHWIDKQLAVEALGGFRVVDREKQPDSRFYDLGARFLIKIVEENELHVYGGAGLALLWQRENAKSEQGVGVEAFAGVEWFFQGLPHLGFTAEAGLGLTDIGDETTFGTRGESFGSLGLRYYF